MLIYCGKCLDGEVSSSDQKESARLVRGHVGGNGMSPRSLLPETVSREVRVSPLQLMECPEGNSGGTAENVFFALRVFLSGRFS